MTQKQVLLALLAALEMAEGHLGGDIEGMAMKIQVEIDRMLDMNEMDFLDFLKEQQDAVLELAASPVLFGCR